MREIPLDWLGLGVRVEVFWTDALLGVLAAVACVAAFVSARREHLRRPWRAVVRRPLGMASLVVLAAYLAVGLLDSVHFRRALPSRDPAGKTQYAPEVLSLFDVVAAPLRERDVTGKPVPREEKTYSAPLSAHLFVRETVERPDGTQTRELPRLKFGGAHLADPERDAAGDIRRRALLSLAAAAAVWGALALGVVSVLALRSGEGWGATLARVARGRTDVPWRAILAAAGGVIAIAGVAAGLSRGYYVLGTDAVGKDVLYQSLKSVRTALVLGTVTSLVMLPFAILLGIMAGYFGGRVDDAIQYVYTTLSSIPSVLLIAAAVLILNAYMDRHQDAFETAFARADLRLLYLCLILGATRWIGLCRLLRGETLKLRESDYVQAASALGGGPFRVLGRHVLPNVMHLVLISVVLDFSGLVLAEAVLSYVGVGVDPSMASWGLMINLARLEMARDPMVWWSLVSAFSFMLVLVLAANLFADAVRDAFDPRIRN